MAKKKLGRPTLLTEKRLEAIRTALLIGMHEETAALSSGISTATYYSWKARAQRELDRVANASDGRVSVTKEEAIYVNFLEVVTLAMAEAEGQMVARWVNASKLDWRANRDLLARRFPSRWGNVERREITQTVRVGGMTDEEADAIVAAGPPEGYDESNDDWSKE